MLLFTVPPDTPVIGENVVTVTQPDEAMFVCTAMARPRPSITWYRVEMENSRTILTQGGGVTINEVDGSTDRIVMSTLTFEPSRPFFSAEYICEATNVVDSAETNATLTVFGKERGRKDGCVDISCVCCFSVACSDECDELHSESD